MKKDYFILRSPGFKIPWSAFMVLLFANQKAMIQYARRKSKDKIGNDTSALLLSYRGKQIVENRQGKKRTSELIGEFLFCEEHTQSNVIAHESAHAAFELFRRHNKLKVLPARRKRGIKDLTKIPTTEEYYCLLLENIYEAVHHCIDAIKNIKRLPEKAKRKKK